MIVFVARYGLGIVLALAVFGKAGNFTAFQGTLATFGIRGRLAQVGAFTVVTVEALTALMVVSPVADVVVGVTGTCLGASFTVAQTYLLAMGEQAPCLCFGSKERASIRTWARAALVLLMGLALWGAAA
ncbi:MauE/DoxX family redox-associated membrane protein [Microtetraspora malaysiensis]|uniref:MauE/DoxX family redox-associated membrane protein n=1 Tax=Microtetraspora malaysiensis TaxID=161358 RepID=UPI00082A6092|nr:MauE/DoxX family redox-associated membrane protein [Microtetraspora malaysiensis]